MHANEHRCIYRRHQLGEVVCQLRFPEILSIGANLPAQFQELIRYEFPQYAAKKEALPPKITGTPGNFSLENMPQTVNYHFISADGVWKVNLTSRFISLSCSRYTCWEDFAKKLDKPLAAFIKTYRPAYFERVGLRYLNFIDRKALGLEDTPYRELIQPCYLGPLALEEMNEKVFARCSIDTEFAIRGGCRAKLHAGPAMVKQRNQAEGQQKFIFDMDLFMPGKIQVNLSAASLQTLHAQSYPLFRGAITDTLHDAMEPESI